MGRRITGTAFCYPLKTDRFDAAVLTGFHPLTGRAMSSEEKSARPEGSSKVAIIIALIGLLGILITALLSNWDKFQSKTGNPVIPAISPEWYGSYLQGGLTDYTVSIFGDSSNATIRMTMTMTMSDLAGRCDNVWEGPLHSDKAGLFYDVKLVSSSPIGSDCDSYKKYDHISGLIDLVVDKRYQEERALHFRHNGSPWQDISVWAPANMHKVSQ